MNWQTNQDRDLQYYLEKGAEGVFSHEKHIAGIAYGDILNEHAHGRILDVGCGLLPLPVYMRLSPCLVWFGIDPLDHPVERKFIFVKAKAEKMPFIDEFYDCVSLATSLDHFENPEQAVNEIYRILKPEGKVFVWTNIFPDDDKFKKWQQEGGYYDEFHEWAYTMETIKKLFYKFVPVKEIEIDINGYVLIFQKTL